MMINRILVLILTVFVGGEVCHAQIKRKHTVDTIAMRMIVDKYAARLSALAQQRFQPVNRQSDSLIDTKLDANFFRFYSPATLYRAPLAQTFGIEWEPVLPGKVKTLKPYIQLEDSVLQSLEEQNRILMRTYVKEPWLVRSTEEQLDNAGELKEEVKPAPPQQVQLAEKEMDIDLTPDVGDIRIMVRRPNFWSCNGDYSLQFTQSYFSENWYQGGENNYTMLALATMNAKYDNKDKVQWENKLEMRLGFQTSKSDEIHKFKTNDDLLRFTTKIGYKAAKRWFYTLQVQVYTQFYPSYNANSHDVSSDFMSPFNMSVSLGMDYKLELNKFKGSAVLTPISYNFRYVDRESLRKNFGIEEGHNTYNYFGPSITVNYTWDIYKNIRWDARIYWFSNLEMTTIEWENTLTFSLTKFLTAKMFLYPRFDDSSPNYRSEDKETYFMFKEWFSLGVNYAF